MKIKEPCEEYINMEEPSEPISRMVFLEKKGKEETYEEYKKKENNKKRT